MHGGGVGGGGGGGGHGGGGFSGGHHGGGFSGHHGGTSAGHGHRHIQQDSPPSLLGGAGLYGHRVDDLARRGRRSAISPVISAALVLGMLAIVTVVVIAVFSHS